MKDKKLKRNLILFTWFKILKNPLFWGPVLISYITNIGKMELSEVYFMESVVVFAMIFVEIYSSAWADLLGRKKTILIGGILNFIAILLFAFASSPLLIWVSNILIMIGISIISGSDEAFLVDTLKESNRYDEFTKINGKIISKVFVISAITSILSGYLYTINPRLPMFLSIPGVLISTIIVFFFHEPKRQNKTTNKEHFNMMKMSILFVANHKKVKWIIGYMALLVVGSKLWFFTYNPYFEMVDIDPKFFGWIFFVLNLVAWVSSKYAYLIEKRINELAIMIIMFSLIAIPILFMGKIVAQISIIWIFFENITRGFREPFFSNFINKHLNSENRATVLSIKSSVNALISGIALWIFGMIIDKFSIPDSLQLLGIIISLLGIYSIFKYRQIFKD